MELSSGRSTGLCLLLALLATNYFNICNGRVTKYTKANENMKRPETTTPQGKVHGVYMVTGRHNRTIFGFLGLPYAQPPVGNLRFKPPVPPSVWEGIWDASNVTDPCSQVFGKDLFENEDCLYLNIYTPKLPSSDNSTLLPVMVYVLGGGFFGGSNTPMQYGPDFLLDQDVVLVVPNFRVGVLGYLSTGDKVAPGNYGLKDMVRALEWTQDNIQYFGGNPNQVTLFGSSSGAETVSFLMLSNLTNGLFHRCIMQSGSALSPHSWRPSQVLANRTIRLGEYFGCPTNTSNDLVNCLRGINTSQLIDTNSLFFVWEKCPKMIWTPTIEPNIKGAFLTDRPENLVAAGRTRDVPYIFSVAKDEGLYESIQAFENSDLFESFLANLDLILPQVIGYDGKIDNVTAYTAALKSRYLNDLTADKSLLFANYTQLLSDIVFFYPANKGHHEQLIHARSPLYICSFEYRGTFSFTYFYSGGSTEYTGVAHGDELLYLFNNHLNFYGPPDYKYSETDLKMVDTMVQLWTSFATNGAPAIMDLNGNITWEPYSSRKNYLQIGNGPNVILETKYNLHSEVMQFFDELNASVQ